MPYENFDFVGSFNKELAPEIDTQNTINMYEIPNENEPKNKSLLPWPGTKQRVALNIESTFGVRGKYRFKNHIYYVFGPNVYLFETDLAPTIIGTLNTSVGFVSIEANLTQVLFVDGSNGWVWDGTSFTQIIDANFPANPTSVTYLDGRFLVNNSATNQFFSSDIENGLVWPPLEDAFLTTKGDFIVGLSMLDRRIYVFGNIVTEAFYDAGSAGFPFARDNNTCIGYGAASAGAIACNDDYIIYVATSKFSPPTIRIIPKFLMEQKISTPEVDIELQNYEKPQDVIVDLFEINGYNFAIFNFTTANKTLLYNVDFKKWTFLSMLDGSRYAYQHHVIFNEKHYVGKYNSPVLYELNKTFFTNDGEPMKRTRITGPFRTANGQRICVNVFEIQFVQGSYIPVLFIEDMYVDENGITYTDEKNEAYWDENYRSAAQIYEEQPYVYLSVSTDGGQNFGNEVARKLGKTGQNNLRTIWTNLGQGDSFVIKMDVYHPVPLVVIGANINYTILRF